MWITRFIVGAREGADCVLSELVGGDRAVSISRSERSFLAAGFERMLRLLSSCSGFVDLGSGYGFIATDNPTGANPMRLLHTISLAAFAGASMLALPTGSASALTLSSPSLEQQVTHAQLEQVYYRGVYRGGYRGGYHGGVYRGGYGYHGYGYGYHGYGYGGAALVGGLAVGAAIAAPHCWINGYGVRVCN
jgi:hypothetical protein